MGANLPSVDLGSGRTAVAVSAGGQTSCALLVRLPNGRLGGLGLQNGAIEPHTSEWGNRTPEAWKGKRLQLDLAPSTNWYPHSPHNARKIDCVRQPARADFNTNRAHLDETARVGLVLDSVLNLDTCQSAGISGMYEKPLSSLGRCLVSPISI